MGVSPHFYRNGSLNGPPIVLIFWFHLIRRISHVQSVTLINDPSCSGQLTSNQKWSYLTLWRKKHTKPCVSVTLITSWHLTLKFISKVKIWFSCQSSNCTAFPICMYLELTVSTSSCLFSITNCLTIHADDWQDATWAAWHLTDLLLLLLDGSVDLWCGFLLCKI